MSSYYFIVNQMIIYGGISLFVIGVVGNLINACIFYNNNLRNPSSFLLFFVSCLNIIYMYAGLLIRILSVGFNIDVTIIHVSVCKIRYTLMQVCVLSSLSCSCYAIIDQFFASSTLEKWRRLSKISLTRKVTLLIVFVYIIYTIPLIIFSDIVERSNGKLICTFFTYNLIFNRYVSYFSLPFIWAIGPISVMIIFGFLTYRNVSRLRNNLHRTRTQRKLTSMILLHVIFIIIGMIPFAFYYTYIAITLSTIKSSDRQALEYLLESVVTIISYFSFSCSFFVYYLSSSTYRSQVINCLTCSNVLLNRVSEIRPKATLNYLTFD